MKTLLSIILSVMFCLTVSAQDEALDSMLAIQTQPEYIYTSVDVNEYSSLDKARRIGQYKLFEAIAKQVEEDVPESVITKNIRQLSVKRPDKTILFLYVSRGDLVIPIPSPASIQPQVTAPAEQNTIPSFVSFKFSEESYTGVSKSSMEYNITKLLNAINSAYKNGAVIDITGISMTDDCRQSLLMGWKHKPYYCTSEKNVKQCLHASENMTVRDIPVYSRNDENHNRYISIAFNKRGQIECVRFAADIASYDKIMKNGGKEITDATDAARRTSILSFVENFRNYYVNMDIDKLSQIYADDAIIISGSVMTTVKKQKGDPNKVVMDKRVIYNRRNKEEYMATLRGLFAKNKEINVLFDEIKVVQDPSKKDFYGVTLKQHWDAKSKIGGDYHDVGYVFLLWDFQNPEHPQIHVRTWQPTEAINKEEDVFGLNSFKY